MNQHAIAQIACWFLGGGRTLKIRNMLSVSLGATLFLAGCNLDRFSDKSSYSDSISEMNSLGDLSSYSDNGAETDNPEERFARNFPSYEEVAEQYPEKTVLVWTIGETGYDWGEGAMRTREVNEYLDSIGKDFAVCFYPIDYDHFYVEGGSYTDKVGEMVAAETPPDIIYTHTVSTSEGYINPYVKCVVDKLFEPLDDYLENTDHGRELYALMPKKHWEGLRINGTVYGIDGSMSTLTYNYGYYVNAELAGKYGYDVTKSILDQLDILKSVKENEKDCDVFSMYTSRLYNPAFFSTIKDISNSVYWDSEAHTAKCAFDDPGYFEKLRLFTDLLANKLLNSMDNKYEDTFFIMQSNKPGGSVIYEDTKPIEVNYFENKVTAVPVFVEPIFVNLSFSATGICSASANKDKAFELLALTQTDRYLNNLLAFGIEGEDYSLDGDTVIETNNYFNPSRFGNYMLCHLWERNDITAEQYRSVFETAQIPSDIDFIFDSTSVHGEFVAAADIMDKFSLPSASDEIGLDEKIALTRAELEEAGIRKIIDECNRQYEVYKNEKS